MLHIEYYGTGWSQDHASAAIAFFNPVMKICFVTMVALVKEAEESPMKIHTTIRIFKVLVEVDLLKVEKRVPEF